MDVFVSYDGDHIGRRVGQAVLADDVGEVRRVDQAINAGNELWRSFAEMTGGQIIEIGGDEGRIVIDAVHLAKMPPIARQYAETVGATVSVGVGMRMSESAKALLVAKLRGGNQIVVWDASMQEELDAATTQPKDEKDKIAEEYLEKEEKATPGQTGATAKDKHTGYTGSSLGSKVKGIQGDHEEAHEAAKAFQDAKDAATAAAPETTHAADDLESQLHDAADGQGKADEKSGDARADHLEEAKKKLVQTLTTVRQNMPVIQQIAQSAPEVYQSIQALIQGLVDLGREVFPQDQADEALQKDELEKSVEQIKPGKPQIGPGGRRGFDYSHHLPANHQNTGLKMRVMHVPGDASTDERLVTELHHNGAKVGSVTAYVNHQKKSIMPHSHLEPNYVGKGLGSAMYEATYSHAKNILGMTHVSGEAHTDDARALHQRLSQKHGFAYKAGRIPGAEPGYGELPWKPYTYALKDEMAMTENDDEVLKSAVSFSKSNEAHIQGGSEAGRHHLNLPVGTVNNGKIKVKHADGNAGWKQVRSGMIQGQEANAPLLGANSHPVSSRSPGSK